VVSLRKVTVGLAELEVEVRDDDPVVAVGLGLAVGIEAL